MALGIVPDFRYGGACVFISFVFLFGDEDMWLVFPPLWESTDGVVFDVVARNGRVFSDGD